MTATVTISDDDVFTALRAFLIAVLPSGVEVVQAQDNGVSMPPLPFVTMNNVGQKRLSTNVVTYTPGASNPGTKAILAPTQYTMQIDFYGLDAGAWASMVQTLFRDSFAVDLFPSNIKPLFADDPIQLPLINAESQYEQRWRLAAVMQTNPVVTVAQDFAAQIAIGVKEVDTSFPP